MTIKPVSSCGIIAEYNPFHNGHAYQLREAQRLSKADTMIVVMSGDFVQRGEPAIVQKQARAAFALQHGADLVVELPFYGAVQSADYFAKVAVDCMHALHVDTLCFGTDIGETFDYSDWIRKEQRYALEIQQSLKEMNQRYPNKSYAYRIGKVYETLFHADNWATSPNHILGLAYARANAAYKTPMQLLPIARNGANHYDGRQGVFASGTATRKAIKDRDWDFVQQVVPEKVYTQLQQEMCHTWDDYFLLLKHQLLIQPYAHLQEIYQMTEGLEHRCVTMMQEADSFASWMERMQTSRYTDARLQRLATYTLLQITQKAMQLYQDSPYLRVLGMNDRGKAWLKIHPAKQPIVTAVRHQNKSILRLEQKLESVYHIKETFDFAQAYRPVIMK